MLPDKAVANVVSRLFIFIFLFLHFLMQMAWLQNLVVITYIAKHWLVQQFSHSTDCIDRPIHRYANFIYVWF